MQRLALGSRFSHLVFNPNPLCCIHVASVLLVGTPDSLCFVDISASPTLYEIWTGVGVLSLAQSNDRIVALVKLHDSSTQVRIWPLKAVTNLVKWRLYTNGSRPLTFTGLESPISPRHAKKCDFVNVASSFTPLPPEIGETPQEWAAAYSHLKFAHHSIFFRIFNPLPAQLDLDLEEKPYLFYLVIATRNTLSLYESRKKDSWLHSQDFALPAAPIDVDLVSTINGPALFVNLTHRAVLINLSDSTVQELVFPSPKRSTGTETPTRKVRQSLIFAKDTLTTKLHQVNEWQIPGVPSSTALAPSSHERKQCREDWVDCQVMGDTAVLTKGSQTIQVALPFSASEELRLQPLHIWKWEHPPLKILLFAGKPLAISESAIEYYAADKPELQAFDYQIQYLASGDKGLWIAERKEREDRIWKVDVL